MATRPTASAVISPLPPAPGSRTSDDYDVKSAHDVETQPQDVVKEDPGVARIEALCESHGPAPCGQYAVNLSRSSLVRPHIRLWWRQDLDVVHVRSSSSPMLQKLLLMSFVWTQFHPPYILCHFP